MNVIRCLLVAMLAAGCASKATSTSPSGTSPPFPHRANDLTCANPPDRPIGLGGVPNCEADSDCIAQNVTPPCLCGEDGGPGVCAEYSNCSTDEQCPGGWCSPSIGPSCGGGPPTFAAYYCRTLDEPCQQDSDCDGGTTCSWNEVTGTWTCQIAMCGAG